MDRRNNDTKLLTWPLAFSFELTIHPGQNITVLCNRNIQIKCYYSAAILVTEATEKAKFLLRVAWTTYVFSRHFTSQNAFNKPRKGSKLQNHHRQEEESQTSFKALPDLRLVRRSSIVLFRSLCPSPHSLPAWCTSTRLQEPLQKPSEGSTTIRSWEIWANASQLSSRRSQGLQLQD